MPEYREIEQRFFGYEFEFPWSKEFEQQGDIIKALVVDHEYICFILIQCAQVHTVCAGTEPYDYAPPIAFAPVAGGLVSANNSYDGKKYRGREKYKIEK